MQPIYLQRQAPSAADRSGLTGRGSYNVLVEEYLEKHSRVRMVDGQDIKDYILKRLPKGARYSTGGAVKAMESRGFRFKKGVFRK